MAHSQCLPGGRAELQKVKRLLVIAHVFVCSHPLWSPASEDRVEDGFKIIQTGVCTGWQSEITAD